MESFDYTKPELRNFDLSGAMGDAASCYIDCTTDDVCPTPADTV